MQVLDSRALVYRFTAPVSALAVFFAMTWLYRRGDTAPYNEILRAWGIAPFRLPFLDISGSLAAWQCARHGIDVLLSNPCDILQRPYAYSPPWMVFSWVPLGVKDSAIVGWIADLLFLLSLALLPRPRRPLELLLVLVATLSTMVVFALERANPDIVLFIMVLAAGFLAEGRFAARLFGYSLALLAALIKYYPIMALLILFRERAARFLSIGVIMLAILATFAVRYYSGIIEGLANIARGGYLIDLFAAKNLPFFLGQLAANGLSSSRSGAFSEGLIGLADYAILVAVCVEICRRLLARPQFRDALGTLGSRERILLVIGSSVILGCFFAGQSIYYRGIYFLLVLPGLLAAARGAIDPRVRRLLIRAGVVIAFLMWEECFRLALYRSLAHADLSAGAILELKTAFFIARELAWWWIVSLMAAIAADFLLRSETCAEGVSLLRRPAMG